MKFFSILILSLSVFVQTAKADDLLDNEVTEPSHIKDTVKSIENSSVADRLKKEATLSAYYLLKGDLLSARWLADQAQTIDNDTGRTVAQGGLFVVSFTPAVYGAWKVLKNVFQAPIEAYQKGSTAYEKAVKMVQTGIEKDGSPIYSQVPRQNVKIPEGIMRAGLSGSGVLLKRATAVVLWSGVVYLTWQGHEALVVSPDQYSVVVMELDQKINHLQQEVSDKAAVSIVGYNLTH